MHKKKCSPKPHPNDVLLRLAEQAFAIPHISHLLECATIVILDLLSDRSNATRFALNIICNTVPTKKGDPTAPHRLNIACFRRVAMKDTPKNVQNAFLAVPPTDDTFITLYFTCLEGRSAGGQLGSATIGIFPIAEARMQYMADKPKLVARSPEGEEVHLEMDGVRIGTWVISSSFRVLSRLTCGVVSVW